MATLNPRASLLSGLRTGGVRSASNPLSNIPRTAAPGASFKVPHISVRDQADESIDDLGDMPQNVFAGAAIQRQVPVTAAVDGNRLSQQQAASAHGLNPNCVPFNSGYNVNLQNNSAQVQLQAQALQMQMMQLEILRLQSLQAQQQNAERIAQAQRQQNQSRRPSFNPPASAGPLSNGFDLRSATLRRANQAEQLKSLLGSNDGQAPMTAAIGGKFGSRASSAGVAATLVEDKEQLDGPPLTPSSQMTTVISGGTSLGASAPNSVNGTNHITTSKSDAAISWRRGGNAKSAISGNRSVSVQVKITPPPSECTSPPPSATSSKARPLPLRFVPAASQPLPVAVDSTESADDTTGTTSSTESNESSKSSEESTSSPTSPDSDLSSNDGPLSPREEATKKLYAGLGIGRPTSATALTDGPAVVSHRMACHPLRQPRGPPSGADELGPLNFASRIRRKAIGGLGALIGARERREFIEAF